MSKNIVFEGWLTKSPPSKRIWRTVSVVSITFYLPLLTKWRKRWFALRHSGELPGQYFLDYYADRNCRRLKGTINLDLCEQVDAGLHMERSNNGTIDPKLRGSVFTIQTQSRTYHLEADCEAEMAKWVDAICRVCGLRSTDDSPNDIGIQNPVSATNEHYEFTHNTGPYIPISECITGVRSQGNPRAFTFDSRNIVMSTRNQMERVSQSRGHLYTSQPYIRPINADFSENDSNISDEECKSLNASQSNIRDWSVAKTFTKLAISPNTTGISEDGPPVPPRPPKTFIMSRDTQREPVYQGPRYQEPVEIHVETTKVDNAELKAIVEADPSQTTSEIAVGCGVSDKTFNPLESMQYCNLPLLPPAVDRALKPRHSSHSVGHIHLSGQAGLQLIRGEEMKPEFLQYLDLDLHTTDKPMSNKSQAAHRKRMDVTHGKSLSAVEAESAYKTVDFLKTEAFNITRQDAEASRNNQQ
ncbi:hypothetical protein K1T71_000240 [Dendrolimus kikuchii]|uniref:Uncharacterized protein n=1 Tax=Dendrolimus kikuchii TaxID=765133 RepID=A0ACC1DK80_9NEOP|nr:hypothetical protein K1T71_000240 [Dendrolimus kikuchii]